MAANNTSFGSDPSSQNTTFVQADPSTFRAVVQKLTGAPPEDPSTQKRPAEIGPRKPAFKLHERRQRKLEIKLTGGAFAFGNLSLGSPVSARNRVFGGEMLMVSPVSPLDFLTARGSPRTPSQEEEEAIAQKGFYLHPSPRAAAPGRSEPELLPLFPLHSPRDSAHNCPN